MAHHPERSTGFWANRSAEGGNLLSESNGLSLGATSFVYKQAAVNFLQKAKEGQQHEMQR
jgi:hypothetical protein